MMSSTIHAALPAASEANRSVMARRELTGPLLIAALAEGRRQEQLARVRQRVHQTVGRSAHFSMSAELGSPSRSIARAARERMSELILVGLQTHGAAGRVATEDAPLQVARTARVPVLAVPPDCVALPGRALVAMDFAEASVRAARTALLTLAVGGRLTLAHVEPDLNFREMGKDGWGEINAAGVVSLFRRLVPELRAPGDIEVETTIVRGTRRPHSWSSPRADASTSPRPGRDRRLGRTRT